jgi:uncharacterized surface protein with fasciclin (FAS1) repeats
MLRATLLAAPLSALALHAYAADVATTIQEQHQFSTLAKAIESAGIAQSLQGEGPYTVFAPTDQAFEQLPEGALDTLMKQENQGQLKRLLQYHLVDGKQIMAKDALGAQTEVDTASGDRLSVDGTGQMVLLVPTGLTVTRLGDQVVVERDITAVAAPAVEVAPAAGGAQGRQDGQSGQSAQSQQGQEAQQAAAQTDVAENSGMPVSEHQQRVLKKEPATEQQQTAPQDSGMPSSPHQQQVLRGQQPGEQAGGQQSKGALREATVVEPDIRADNGVIHAIDAVLIPQSALTLLESKSDQSGQSGSSKPQQGSDKQG